ncbi:MAG: hypothetical protein ACUVRZ_10040, partial [Desulfobacca sp.]
MLATLTVPPDYWAFLAGLNGFLLFLVCLVLQGDEQLQRFFTWLGFFAVCLWVQQWLILIWPLMGTTALWTEAVVVLLILAMASLGIAGAVSLPRPGLRLLLLGLLLLLTAGGLATGNWGISWVYGPIFLGLGLVSSLAAGVGLAGVARGIQTAVLRWAALALTGYGLAVLLTGLPELLGLEGEQATSIVWPLVPGQLAVFQVCFGFLSTALLWWYTQREGWRHQARTAATASLSQALAFLVALGILLALGGVSVGLFEKSLDREMRESLAQRVRVLAAVLPLQSIRLLTGTAEDEGTPAYINLKQLLARIRTANGDCRFLYILHFRDGQPVFLVDSEPEDSSEVSPPGQVFWEASERLKAMAACPQAFVEGPQTDRWGTWISAYEVLRDTRDGVFLGVLGLDIDIRDWQRQIAWRKLLPMGIILLMVMLWSGFYFFKKKKVVGTLENSQSDAPYRSVVGGRPQRNV